MTEVAVQTGSEALNLSENELAGLSDIMICLMGDGTFLKVARSIVGINKPLLG